MHLCSLVGTPNSRGGKGQYCLSDGKDGYVLHDYAHFAVHEATAY